MSTPSKRAIVTVGINPQRGFRPYLARFDQTFRKTGYGCADQILIWGSDWPPGSPSHHDCHYAFKAYAIKEARRRGATSVLWLDSSANAIKSIELLWEEIEREGHFFCHGEDRLGNWVSDHCLEHFGVTRDEAMELRLFSGTCFGFDFTNQRTCHFFDKFLSYAVPEHFNGTHVSRLRLPGVKIPEEEGKRMSEDPRCRGHRSDEPYMGLLARQMGMKSYGLGLFAGGMGAAPESVICSGYDLPPDSGEAVLEVIGEHTIDTMLVSGGGWVLDVGCRDFSFSRELARRGCKVIALDCDPTIEDPKIDGVAFLPLALAAEAGEMEFVMSRDPQARHLASGPHEAEQAPRVKVQVGTIEALMEGLGMNVDKIGTWDVVKLDVEGAEYDILRNWPGPISKSISIEFHEHVQAREQRVYDEIFEHLGQWYRVVQHVKEARHCCAPNYWDTYLTLKEPFIGQV